MKIRNITYYILIKTYKNLDLIDRYEIFQIIKIFVKAYKLNEDDQNKIDYRLRLTPKPEKFYIYISISNYL